MESVTQVLRNVTLNLECFGVVYTLYKVQFLYFSAKHSGGPVAATYLGSSAKEAETLFRH